MSVVATNWVLCNWVTSLSVGNFDILTWGQKQRPLHVEIEIFDSGVISFGHSTINIPERNKTCLVYRFVKSMLPSKH